MTRDELEFSISQYLDGTLGARERGALDERLATDHEARALFAEYQSLQHVLAAAPLPDVRWDALASQISGAVARAELPAQSYKIGRWMSRTTWAVAASVVIAAAVAFSVLRGGGDAETTVASEPISIVRNDVPATVVVNVEVQPTIVIAIGPAQSSDDSPIVLRYADSVVQRPSKALIVSAAPAAQDNPLAPF